MSDNSILDIRENVFKIKVYYKLRILWIIVNSGNLFGNICKLSLDKTIQQNLPNFDPLTLFVHVQSGKLSTESHALLPARQK